MRVYPLPSELEAEGRFLHPLTLCSKYGLSIETVAHETAIDPDTLRRYGYPDHATNKRRPYRNKTILRSAAILDELWTKNGCPYTS